MLLSKGVMQSASNTRAPISLLLALKEVEIRMVSLDVACSVVLPVVEISHSLRLDLVIVGAEVGFFVGELVGFFVGEEVAWFIHRKK